MKYQNEPMYKKYIVILMLLCIGLASLAIKSNSVKASAYGTVEPAGLASNVSANNTTSGKALGDNSTQISGQHKDNPTQIPSGLPRTTG
ncbi:MAG: hypothetical protein WB511_10260 [Nitrososphaeraceae archaeon]